MISESRPRVPYPGYRTGGRPSTGGMQIIRHGMSPT